MGGANLSLPHGYRLAFHDTLDSTNAEALRRASAGEPHGLWVWARAQTAGRGRHGRDWQSPAGNLFASLLLRPACTPRTATQLGFIGGLALFDTARALAGPGQTPDFRLKWPNDLLLDGRKAGGVLLESSSDGKGVMAVVLGAGLNLATHPHDTAFPATDLAHHGIGVMPGETLQQLAHACDHWLGIWGEGQGFADIRASWMERSLPVGTPFEVRLADERLEGRYNGIAADGALLLACGDGRERRVTTGDVFPL